MADRVLNGEIRAGSKDNRRYGKEQIRGYGEVTPPL